MNKIWCFIKSTIQLSFFLFGFEYLLYALLSAKNKLYYLFFVVFIMLLASSITELNKKQLFNTIINSAIALSAALLGMCILGMLVKFGL